MCLAANPLCSLQPFTVQLSLVLFQVSELLNCEWSVAKLDVTIFHSLLPKDAHFCLKHNKLVHTLLYINVYAMTYDTCQFHLKCNNFTGIVTIKCQFHVRCNNFVGIVIFFAGTGAILKYLLFWWKFWFQMNFVLPSYASILQHRQQYQYMYSS